MSLTAVEIERGWVEFACDAHGFLVATKPNATVWCRCGKRARAQRHGRLVDPDTLKPTQAKARKLNAHGHPFIHACGDCGQDFGGTTLQRRHRTGRGSSKRCLPRTRCGPRAGTWTTRGDGGTRRGATTSINSRPRNTRSQPGSSRGKVEEGVEA